MKKSYKKFVSVALLCSALACTNSFALPKWLEDLLNSFSSFAGTFQSIPYERKVTALDTIRLNTQDKCEQAYSLYLLGCVKNNIKNPIGAEKIVAYCPDGIKLVEPSENGSSGQLLSWVKFDDGKFSRTICSFL